MRRRKQKVCAQFALFLERERERPAVTQRKKEKKKQETIKREPVKLNTIDSPPHGRVYV